MTTEVTEERVIDVTDLRRVYGGGPSGRDKSGQKTQLFEAVRGVTFSVGRGELFALLGTNGAGKTSTLELLEGLAPPRPARSASSAMIPTGTVPRSGHGSA